MFQKQNEVLNCKPNTLFEYLVKLMLDAEIKELHAYGEFTI
jgi:hypothetical protein